MQEKRGEEPKSPSQNAGERPLIWTIFNKKLDIQKVKRLKRNFSLEIMKKVSDKEQLESAIKEIKMWRKRYIDHELFFDMQEEKWFTEMLMSREPGLENIDEYADFMLKGYRIKKRENT